MKIDVKRELPLSSIELDKLLYESQEDDLKDVDTFVDRRGVNYNCIPQNYPRGAKLGDLITIEDKKSQKKRTKKKMN